MAFIKITGYYGMKIYLVHLKEKSREIQKAAARKLLDQLAEKPTELIYGSYGKPYLKGNPWYFNISHSGEYLLFVQGQHEVGADIQIRRPCNVERLARKRRRVGSNKKRRRPVETLLPCLVQKGSLRKIPRLWSDGGSFHKKYTESA